MRYFWSLIAFLTVNACLAGEQEPVRYRITYDCDMNFCDNRRKVTRFNLDVGDSTAVFYSIAYRGWCAAEDSICKTDHIDKKFMPYDKLMALGDRFQYSDPLQVMYNVPQRGRYMYSNHLFQWEFVYDEALPTIGWHIADSCKVINGYVCHNATGELYGRHWSVWYAEDVPIIYGPYLLWGLPGLVMEAVEAEGHFTINAVGIENAPAEATVDWCITNEIRHCTRKKFVAFRNGLDNMTRSEYISCAMGDGDISKMKIYDSKGKEVDPGERIDSKHYYFDKE